MNWIHHENAEPLIPDSLWESLEDAEPIPVRERRYSVGVSQIDVESIERAADALIRLHASGYATALYALALRLRAETGLKP